MPQKRILLIGGSSHVGKSTLAQSLASDLGWKPVSTDKLARHPGRPWLPDHQNVPCHVADHYLSLTVDELLADVLRHYKSMWPMIGSLISSHLSDSDLDGLILEGSALWPELVATIQDDAVAAVWLTAQDGVLESRIFKESRFDEADARGRSLIRKFVQRTLLFDEEMMKIIERLGLISIGVTHEMSKEELSEKIRNHMGKG